MQNQSKHNITFDTQLKTALSLHFEQLVQLVPSRLMLVQFIQLLVQSPYS